MSEIKDHTLKLVIEGMWLHGFNKDARLLEKVDVELAALKEENERLKARVAELEKAAIGTLNEIRVIMGEAYNSAYPVCCGRSGEQCCGNPEPEWQEFDQRMMDRLAPHEQALSSALSIKEPANEG